MSLSTQKWPSRYSRYLAISSFFALSFLIGPATSEAQAIYSNTEATDEYGFYETNQAYFQPQANGEWSAIRIYPNPSYAGNWFLVRQLIGGVCTSCGLDQDYGNLGPISQFAYWDGSEEFLDLTWTDGIDIVDYTQRQGSLTGNNLGFVVRAGSTQYNYFDFALPNAEVERVSTFYPGQTNQYLPRAIIGSSGDLPPSDLSTRIIEIFPEQNTATTSDPAIYGSYFNASPVYDRLLIDLSWVEPSVNADLLLSGLAHRQFIFDVATSSSPQEFSTTTSDLLTGRWLMSAVFSNGETGAFAFTATTSTFIVGTTTTLFSDFYQPYSTSTPGEPTQACSEAETVIERAICALGDRIRDLLQFLFVPNTASTARFAELKDRIMQRVPFGYPSLVLEAIKGIGATTTAQYELPQADTARVVFDPMRTGISWLIYGVWGFLMFRRVKNIQL